jgi:predicted ATPase
MVVEDAHWIDPTSLEVFSRAVDRSETLRVLLIVTFRPEFDPPWIGRAHATAMTINRLTKREIGAMIDGVVGNKLLPANIRQDIIQRTDGIPLFVEEMTKAVLEAESEGAAQRALAGVPSSALTVPASLHASLMARLDRLGPAKEVAQIGAAVGREFSHALLASVVRKPEAELVSALNRLVEAAAHLSRALAQIANLPGTPALRREQIKLQVGLVNALMHTKGFASPETKGSLDQARSLIEQAEALGEPLEDPLTPFSILYGFWAANFVAFNGDVVRELAAQFLVLAEKQRAKVLFMIGHRLMGMSLVMIGDIAQGRAHLDRAISLYDPVEHRSLATRFGVDIGVSILAYRSLALWALGYPETALADAERAVQDARVIGQTALMYALLNTLRTVVQCGDYATANIQADELVALADEKGALVWKATVMIFQGLLFALTGKASDAVQLITSGITERRPVATIFMPLFLPYLARAHAELGQFDDAWRCIGEAMTAMDITTKERWCEAEVHRTAGEIALMLPEPDAAKAEANFALALAVARAQQAKSWELRSAMSMARLWHGQGKRQQAHDLLAPVYGWFTEGFDTLDLKQAKALLDELR